MHAIGLETIADACYEGSMKDIRQEVLKRLLEVKLPAQKQNVVDAKMITRLDLQEKSLLIEYKLPELNSTFEKSLRFQTEKALGDITKEYEVAVEFIAAKEVAAETSAPKIGTVIAIGSGKGGVGKSAVTVNLAMALKKLNYKVGIVDCDIYGPSIPTMMGVEGQKPMIIDGKIQPIEAHGIQLMSAGFFVEANQGLIWRGPMIHKLIQQFYGDVAWNGTDVLLIDLPPGTGDAPLSLAQTMPLSGAIMVSLPQKISIVDVRRAYAMFNQVKVPVLGLLENMSEFACPSCGHREAIFSKDGVEKLSTELGVPFFGSIPIDPKIRELSDEGKPYLLGNEDRPAAKAFIDTAKRMQSIIRTADEIEAA